MSGLGHVSLKTGIQVTKEKLVRIFVVLESFILQEISYPHEVSKALFKPEIIPPFHRDKIPKPHMGKLMQSNVMHPQPEKLGLRLLWLQITISKRNSPHIFHSPNPELRTEDLIILLPWEIYTSVRLIKFDTFINNSHEFLSIDIRFFGIP
jgi:hypothetical protein